MTLPRTATTFAPPVMEARRWLDGVDFSERPLINVSQAAPVDPPPLAMRQAMAQMIVEDDVFDPPIRNPSRYFFIKIKQMGLESQLPPQIGDQRVPGVRNGAKDLVGKG